MLRCMIEIGSRQRNLPAPPHVVWSSRRPDAWITFELMQGGSGGGTDLRWTLAVDEPAPDESLTGHLRKRINTLIHADLRHTYGQ